MAIYNYIQLALVHLEVLRQGIEGLCCEPTLQSAFKLTKFQSSAMLSGRAINILTPKRGKLSIQWFQRCCDQSVSEWIWLLLYNKLNLVYTLGILTSILDTDEPQ